VALEEIFFLSDVTDAVEAATVSPRALAKQLQLGNTATLERRIRRELEDIGLYRDLNLTYALSPTDLSNPALSCADTSIFLQLYLHPAVHISFSRSLLQVFFGRPLPLGLVVSTVTPVVGGSCPTQNRSMAVSLFINV